MCTKTTVPTTPCCRANVKDEPEKNGWSNKKIDKQKLKKRYKETREPANHLTKKLGKTDCYRSISPSFSLLLKCHKFGYRRTLINFIIFYRLKHKCGVCTLACMLRKPCMCVIYLKICNLTPKKNSIKHIRSVSFLSCKCVLVWVSLSRVPFFIISSVE